ncbi:hypothetical protein SEUCBS140593_002251 [Sporothrix eucalyptigena]|uniref:Xylanolytic transcriptional activator regulatory domain-containing protein n=1 Tax=Sporothrix eucalyptigena TaxID=1812306 RepID=A0ABP0B519_9PEZI
MATTSAIRHVQQRQSQNTDFNMDTLQLEAPIATLRSLGAISPDMSKQEARQAVHIFFTNCHPWAPFLDDELAQKGEELGDRNPLLFLAVVSIGAQFWAEPASFHGNGTPTQPHLHPRYFELAALLDTAVSRLLLAPVPSDATIDSVCALLLYSQWMPYLREGSDDTVKSRYNDLSAWVVFGLAVRYASFLGLERRITRPFKNNGASETAWATRTDFAWARVWLNLVTYDCNLTLTSGLPASIDPTRVEVMARLFGQHRLAQFPGDLRYSALVELACIMQRARDGERKGSAGGTYARGHPNVDVLKRANMGFEDWERQWLPKLRNTHMQHIQLPFTSLRWYQLALNSSALRRILSLSGDPSDECERQQDPQPVPVWALGALEIGLTAAAQILFSLTTGACNSVWHIQSQDPSTFPSGPFTVDAASRHSLYHAVDSLWISHAFALIFLELCYVRGRIDDDLRICSLTPASSNAHRAPTKPRPMSILARLAQLTLDIFQPQSRRGGSDVAAFRPIHKISTLVANATSLVLSAAPTTNDNFRGDASPTPTAPVAGFDDSHADLQGLFNLMDDSELGWPATLSAFNEDPFTNVTTSEWPM